MTGSLDLFDRRNKIWMMREQRGKSCVIRYSPIYIFFLFFVFFLNNDRKMQKHFSFTSKLCSASREFNSLTLMWWNTMQRSFFSPVQPSEPRFSHKCRHQINRTPPSSQPLITFNFSLKDNKWGFALLRFTVGATASPRDPHWASWSMWERWNLIQVGDTQLLILHNWTSEIISNNWKWCVTRGSEGLTRAIYL